MGRGLGIIMKNRMPEEMFNECSNHYHANEREFWGSLASNYDMGRNALRKWFQRELKWRGMSLKVKIKASNPSDYITQTETKAVVRKDFPKVLVFDIESLPILAFVWGVYDQRVLPENVVQDFTLASWSAKWLFEEEVKSMALTPGEAIEHNDKRIVQGLWELIDESDIVITYNGDNFDLPKMNTRFIVNGLSMPNPYKQSIDLIKPIRRVFGNTCNKLDYVNKILGLDRKIENSGMDLWRKCYFGDATALKEMERYNRGDVVITESLYLAIRPWIMNHPNLNIWSDGETAVCKNCGNSVLTWLDKYYYTSNAKYQTCKCEKCGSYGRSKVNLVTKEKRKVNIA
jgi:DNA polymerase III epsilon subunit-like protein